MSANQTLGSLLNDAIRVKPSDNPSEPKSAHLTLADLFWTQLGSGDDSVVGELNKIMNFLLTQSKRETQLERAIWFMSFCFSQFLLSNDELRQSSANSFFGILCDRSFCENKTVRFRSCQFIRTVLDNVSDGLELDEEIAETVYNSLLSRCEDRSHEVRTQALFALDRFKIAGEDQQYRNCQVTKLYHQVLRRDPHPGPRAAALNCLPVTRKAIKALCERTRDESDVVRMTAFKVISWRIHPEQMGTELTGKIVQNGYEDRSDLVVRLCQEILLSWFMNQGNQDFITFFSFFNPKTHGDIHPKMMDSLLLKKPVAVIQAAKRLLKSKRVAHASTTDEEMLIWRTILCAFKLHSDALGMKSVSDRNDETKTQSETLSEFIDLALPQTFKQLSMFFWNLFIQEEYFKTGQLLEIMIQCCNFTEEADKSLAGELYKAICRHFLQYDLKCKQFTIDRVFVFGKCIFSDVQEFMFETMTLLEERKHQMVENEDWRIHCWCHFAFAMIQTLSPSIHNVMSLGTSEFTILHILQPFTNLLDQISDSDGLKPILIKGIGAILCLEMTEESRETYLPLLWDFLESPASGVVIASLEVFSTLAMAHGIRKLDSVPATVVPTVPYPDLWTYDYTNPLHSESLPGGILSLFEANNGAKGKVQVAVVQTLGQLLTMNQFQNQHGMDVTECVQCLSPLIRFFSLAQSSDKHLSCIQQFLRVFFERFCRVHLRHQFLLRLAFLPVLHDSMTDWTHLKTPPITAVVKLMSNLIKTPLRSSSATAEQKKQVDQELAKMDAQLICLLLWELSECPSNTTTKSYISAIWKLVLDFKMEEYEERQKTQILTVLNHLKSEEKLKGKNIEVIKTRLVNQNVQNIQEIEDQTSIAEISSYMEKFGQHPFVDE